jgi:hypothetical protein
MWRCVKDVLRGGKGTLYPSEEIIRDVMKSTLGVNNENEVEFEKKI